MLRKLTGYTQSNLVQCDDGRLYVAKLYPNPQSSNSLANEAIGATLLSYLEIPTPSWRVLSVSKADLVRFPQLGFDVVGGRREPKPGLHFASQYLADLDHSIVDFWERPSGGPVLNVMKFLDIYLFDIWAYHRDRRQHVYKVNRQSGLGKVVFIDNSHLFGNRSWGQPEEEGSRNFNVWNKPPTHTYDYLVSRRIQEFRRRIPEFLHYAMADVPPEWHGSDIDKLEAWLLQRLSGLRELVESNLAFHGHGP